MTFMEVDDESPGAPRIAYIDPFSGASGDMILGAISGQEELASSAASVRCAAIFGFFTCRTRAMAAS